MPRTVKLTVVPVLGALAVFFMVLPQRGADATVRISGPAGAWAFAPAEVRIDPGERIAFDNDSKVTHSVTCVSDDCFDLGDIQPAQVKFLTVEEVGVYEYVCRYHGRQGMSGRILVGPVPEPDTSPSA